MTERNDLLPDYVRATLALQGYAFSDERLTEITLQFARFAAIAATLPPADPAEPAASGAAHSGRLPAAPAPVFRP